MAQLKIICSALILSATSAVALLGQNPGRGSACLDGFCIGQSIEESRFDEVHWIVPQKQMLRPACGGIGCRPEVAFRGYPSGDQKRLADALSPIYGLAGYNVITKANLDVLRRYRYECDLSPRGTGGERRFFGAYLSAPSGYLTVVGLRLVGGKLTVYRIARQYPYHNPNELISLGRKLHDQYGDAILFVNYLSSNAYSEVIEQNRDGWFGRSKMFNPTDLSDNAAELVLIDPRTRALLEPSSMPESGEIRPLPVTIPGQCSTSPPLQ